MPGVVVIGAGRGVGRSVALRFAREGMPVALIARSEQTVRDVARDLSPLGVPVTCLTADSADEAALRSALDAAAGELGLPDVLVYNAAIIRADALGELPASGQLEAWAVNVVGALTAAAHLLPAMAQRGTAHSLSPAACPIPTRTTSACLSARRASEPW